MVGRLTKAYTIYMYNTPTTLLEPLGGVDDRIWLLTMRWPPLTLWLRIEGALNKHYTDRGWVRA